MLQVTIYVRIFLSDLLCHNFEKLTVFANNGLSHLNTALQQSCPILLIVEQFISVGVGGDYVYNM